MLHYHLGAFGTRIWNGTRYGISKEDLEKLFPSRLKPVQNVFPIRDYTLSAVPWAGDADTPEHFCGADLK
jgi:hypothetical protein